MKKLLLLTFIILSLNLSAQLNNMEGAWELQERDGLLAYTCIAFNHDEKKIEILNSSSRHLSASVNENIISQNKNEIITEYGFNKLGYSLTTKTFLYKEVLHRVILESKDTLRYKLIHKVNK
tara:strand:- start:389 stop:754 length:366 start_codon:yes stop_codon:yes gene_type:complete